MGSGIVSNLLKMGHVVTVWNRTAEKVLFTQSSLYYFLFVCSLRCTNYTNAGG